MTESRAGRSATPSRRVYGPVRRRPTAAGGGGAEDKIVQRRGRRAECDLRGRLPRLQLRIPAGAGSARRARRPVGGHLRQGKVNYIVDADIAVLRPSVSKEWLARSLEHRIGDKRVLRLIQKWLRAGVLEDGRIEVPERGTGQGAAITQVLANVYLHYVLDLWAERWRRREAKGDMVIVRYADDTIFGFESETDARRFLDAMRERLAAFALTLHPDKTRLIEFGRFAAANRERRGLSKPETFKFLGFIFICGKSRKGGFLLKRKSRGDRMRAKLKEIKEARESGCMNRRLDKGNGLARWSKAGSTTTPCPPTFACSVRSASMLSTSAALARRRSQKDVTTWERIESLAREWLPPPKILHPWPSDRFRVKHLGGSRMRESRPVRI